METSETGQFDAKTHKSNPEEGIRILALHTWNVSPLGPLQHRVYSVCGALYTVDTVNIVQCTPYIVYCTPCIQITQCNSEYALNTVCTAHRVHIEYNSLQCSAQLLY